MTRKHSFWLRQWTMGAVICTVAVAEPGGAGKASRRPAILGHRGALMLAPENTLAAFGMCLGTGTDIELDIWPTKDGELVVIHDDTVNRTTNGTGRVADLTLRQIRQLDAGSWFHEDFAGERIPTFGQVLRYVKANERHPTVVAVNIKPVNEVVIDGVIDAIRESDFFDRTFLFDLSLENTRLFKTREPRLRCAASPRTPEQLRAALATEVIDVIWSGPQSKATIDLVHSAGKAIYVTIVNNAVEWLRLKADGVDGICTNHPIRMKEAAWPPPAERMWDHNLEPEKRSFHQFKSAPVSPVKP